MIRDNRFRRKYLAEFIYGGIDGTVTTFAIISGTLGAALSPAIILILGFANLFADGFSMAVSNYLSTKSQAFLDGKRGKHPLKTALATFVSFVCIGFIPLASFVAAPFYPFVDENKFAFSIVLTSLAFLTVGAAKSLVTGESKTRGAVETLIVGGVAATIAFFVGYFLRGLVV